jgi:glycosyltransferase involved in cell wall biosynthesis
MNEQEGNYPKKVNKLLFTQTNYKQGSTYQTWYPVFKHLSRQLIFFDTHLNRILYGKKEMNKKFLDIIRKEKPDYIHMCFGPDEFELSTLLNIRKVSPNTKTLIAFGDDDIEFERFSRYIMLFVDFGLVHQIRYLKNYKEEGIDSVFGIVGLDNNFFKFMDLEKKYDVTFIGLPLSEKSGRYKLIKFLKENGINIQLFGWGWDNYSDFKDIYRGPLSSEELVKVLNQSKINLCLSKNQKGEPHLKAKPLEASSCKTFALTEYCDEYERLFKQGKEMIMFDGEKDLLNKVKYYLKNEKEREKIAEAAYKRINKDYNLTKIVGKIFDNISRRKIIHRDLPEFTRRVFYFSERNINKRKEEIKNILKDYEYVSFIKDKSENLNYREFLQIYSIKITKKPISCCDYYVYKKNLGDYLYFQTEPSLRELEKKDFYSFLNISQLLIKKEYFLENLEKFQKAFKGEIDFIDSNNTAFVGFPLVRIKDISVKEYPIMKKAFSFNFFHDLYVSYNTKKIFYTTYLPALILEGLSGKHFIFRYLYESIFNKERLKRLKIYKASARY